MRKVSRGTIAVSLMLVLLASGCRHNINTNNPKVVFVNTLLAGAQSCDLVATGLKDANDTLEKLQATEPEYYASVKPKLQAIARANDKAIAALRAAQAGDASADWRAALIAVANEAGSGDLSQFGFKNPNSQATAKIMLASLQLALQAITNTWGTK
jgi:hypothetical protein